MLSCALKFQIERFDCIHLAKGPALRVQGLHDDVFAGSRPLGEGPRSEPALPAGLVCAGLLLP